MKHNKEYRFSDDVKSVQDVIRHLNDLGWKCRYLEISMADGTKRKFVNQNSYQYIEIPDLTTALALVTDDIYILKELYDNGYLVEDK